MTNGAYSEGKKVEWKPISQLPKRINPNHVYVYRYAPVPRPERPYAGLKVMYSLESHAGHRVLTHFTRLDKLEKDLV